MPSEDEYQKIRGECIGIISGKGGVGKSILTVNLGAALARMGRRVLCMDCAAGLRGLDLALGLSDASAMNFMDVAMGECDLKQAVIAYPDEPGLFLLNAPVNQIADGDWNQSAESGMMDFISQIREEFDDCLMDAPPGFGFGFELASKFSSRVIVVTQMEPSAIRDAQKAVIRLEELYPGQFPDGKINLIINRVRRSVLFRTRMTIDDAMDQAGLPLLGLIPEDMAVLYALHRQQPVTVAYPSSRAAGAIRNIARRITGKAIPLARMPW